MDVKWGGWIAQIQVENERERIVAPEVNRDVYLGVETKAEQNASNQHIGFAWLTKAEAKALGERLIKEAQ